MEAAKAANGKTKRVGDRDPYEAILQKLDEWQPAAITQDGLPANYPYLLRLAAEANDLQRQRTNA